MNKILIGAAAISMMVSFGVSGVANAGDKELEALGIVAVEHDKPEVKGHEKRADTKKTDERAAKDAAMNVRQTTKDKDTPM